MHVAYLLYFLTLLTFAETRAPIQIIPTPQSPEDFEHQYKGCPTNSECDQVMGHRLEEWKKLIDKLRGDEIAASKKTSYLEMFRSKYGIPVEFYTSKKSQGGLKPLYFNSHCKSHNPKKEEHKILKGTAFLKSLEKGRAIVMRDHVQLEVPLDNNLLTLQPVIAYYEGAPKTYLLPIEDQPLFIKNRELYVLKEEDNYFFALKVSENGDWKIVDLDLTKLSVWEDKRSNVTCPEDKARKIPEAFEIGFCKTVWDEDLKKTVTVKMHQGCTI